MEKGLLLGLFGALLLIAGIWSAPLGTAIAQEEQCNTTTIAEPPVGPAVPDILFPTREVVEGATEPQLDIRLHWVNRSPNSRCFHVEVKLTPETDCSVEGGQWGLLETIPERQVTQYLHEGVSATGSVWYRVYASNREGRSDYSRRVCLILEGFGSGGTDGGGKFENGSPIEGSGSGPWLIVGIVLGLAAVATVGGVLVWRRRRTQDFAA